MKKQKLATMQTVPDNPLWTAQRLLDSLLEFGSPKMQNIVIKNDFPKESPGVIRIEQLMAVLKAYGAETFTKAAETASRSEDEIIINLLSGELSESRFREVAESLKCESNERLLEDSRSFCRMNACDARAYQRERFFGTLIEYYHELNKLRKFGNGYLTCDKATAISILYSRDLYRQHIEEAHQKVGRLILLLMGEKFEKTFTVEQLIDSYGYPAISEEELSDMEIDWM